MFCSLNTTGFPSNAEEQTWLLSRSSWNSWMKRKHVVVFTCGRYMRWYRNSTSFHSSYEAVSWSNTRLMTTSLSGGGARGNTTSSASCHGDRSGRTSSYNRGRGGQLILFTFWRLTSLCVVWVKRYRVELWVEIQQLPEGQKYWKWTQIVLQPLQAAVEPRQAAWTWGVNEMERDLYR